VAWCSGRNRHAAILRRVPQRLKPFDLSDFSARLKPCP
jgi:hypothetical protein